MATIIAPGTQTSAIKQNGLWWMKLTYEAEHDTDFMADTGWWDVRALW